MKVVFRVDASITMGTGHVMRCRTLATELQKRGADVHFVTRAHPGHMGDMLAREGFAVSLLPPPSGITIDDDDYAVWLGVSEQIDADQTIAALENLHCDWLIVDHYGLGLIWETRLRSHTVKLMAIDDLANRPHACDVLLDQNYAKDSRERYQALVPSCCQLLLGPYHALLRPEYVCHPETMSPRTDSIKSVLVFLGGADCENVTGMILAALCSHQLKHLEVTLVIGHSSTHKDSVTLQATSRPNTHIYGHQSHLADLMAKADLAIGAGGATMWERMCMGLPSIVMSIADNQAPACQALESSGLIRYLGAVRDLDVAAVEVAMIEALASAEKLRDMATRGQAIVDGRGASRVAEVLIPSSKAALKLRAATSDDVLTYFAWVNDPEVRSSAISTAFVDLQTHLRWFNGKLTDERAHLFVLELGDLPVGQIRFEVCGEETTIDYSLDVLVRGRGWAKRLVRLGIDALNTSRQPILTATVKPENIVSAATFIRLGFVEQAIDSSGNRRFLLPSLKTRTRKLSPVVGLSNG
jgi:UDP-2,4-diacetamido-2,4,6-trideoxy-beta-L-altropyranose hydrolase